MKFIQKIVITALAACMPFQSYTHNHVKTVFYTPELRQTFGQFIDNVLMQIPAKDFFAHIDTMPDLPNALTDHKIYAQLLPEISTLTPRFSVYHKIASLQNQKNVLSQQIRELLGDNTHIDGCVEIGSPGTYTNTIKKFATITGTIYAINDKQELSDHVKAFSWNIKNKFLPYDQFISLNDYAPITEQAIPSNSVDLVICFIGLHHIPQEKLAAFVASIGRILRPGGTFILRDHNIINDDLMHMTHAAHSVFNLLMVNEPLENEIAEYRNFQPLQHWIDLLQQNGFAVGTERLLQKGDPTHNTMLKFTKIAESSPESSIDKEIKISQDLKKDPNYKRDQILTFLGGLEWYSVDLAREYADFINHTPFYKFPYMKSVGSLWKIFGNSWKTAAKKEGHFAVLTSPYTLMNMFMGITLTVELTGKAIISAPAAWAFAGEELGPIKLLVKDPNNEIESFDSRINSVKKFDLDSKLVEMPRFKEFIAVLQKLSHSQVILQEIAGNKEIQLKVRKKNSHSSDLNLEGCTVLYDWQIPTQPDFTYYAVTVQVNKLLDVIKNYAAKGIEVLYAHDF